MSVRPSFVGSTIVCAAVFAIALGFCLWIVVTRP